MPLASFDQTYKFLSSQQFDFVWQNKNDIAQSVLGNKDGVETKVVKVLLLTYFRGGSSFLGESFNTNKDAFYWFEPLAGKHICQKFINQLFNIETLNYTFCIKKVLFSPKVLPQGLKEKRRPLLMVYMIKLQEGHSLSKDK